jgi:chromosome segregation ATPase
MKKSKKSTAPKKSGQIPATQKMLDLAKRELKSQMTSIQLEMRGQFKGVDGRFKSLEAHFNDVDARFNKVDARFKDVDARFDKVDARFDSMDAKIETLIAAVHKSNANVEEQNARNLYVLDGYSSIYDSQVALKARVENLEKSVFGKRQS